MLFQLQEKPERSETLVVELAHFSYVLLGNIIAHWKQTCLSCFFSRFAYLLIQAYRNISGPLTGCFSYLLYIGDSGMALYTSDPIHIATIAMYPLY